MNNKLQYIVIPIIIIKTIQSWIEQMPQYGDSD